MIRSLILVCTYNEIANLPSLVDRIHANVLQSDILVIDDGSPDGTSKWAEEAAKSDPRLHLINRGSKQGLGSAIKQGLQYAIDNHYDAVVNLDADFSHDPDKISELIRLCHLEQNDPNDLVIGSRYVPGGGLANCSWKRIFTSKAANFFARWLLKWPFKDCSSAYRCYRVAALKAVDFERLTCTGYGFLEEILWHLWKNNSKIIEAPIIYTERERGASKISFAEAKGTIGVLRRLSRMR